MVMAEIHGVLHATRQSAGGYSGEQRVTVSNDGAIVRLAMGTSSYPAGLTPQQARYLAAKLYRIARLAEADQ